MEKLAIIVPTKDRHAELRQLLESLSGQDTHPSQVVVVDGGKNSCKELLGEFPRLKIDYVRSLPPSLTRQRNGGIRRVVPEATLVGFLDDDVTLEKGAVSNMLKFWDSAPENTGGAGFNLNDSPYRAPTLIEKIFFVNGEKSSMILRSGFQSKVAFVDRTKRVDWLVGCLMVWRRRVFDEFMFDEWFVGYARYEDVDFSYRVGRKYGIYIVADAVVNHPNYKLEDASFSRTLGTMEIVNRIYLVRKNKGLSLALCLWACFGFFLNNLVKGVFMADRRYFLRACGNAAGFAKFVFTLGRAAEPVKRGGDGPEKRG